MQNAYPITALVLTCVQHIALLALVSITSLSAGTTYYVDSQAGHDKNPGTSNNAPWKTLEKVNKKTFLPGDIVLFKSGSVWTGQLWPKGSGKVRQPIVIDKYDGEKKPLIQGAGLTEDTVILKNQEYWEIRNLEITNTGKGDAVRRGVNVVIDVVGGDIRNALRSLAPLGRVMAVGFVSGEIPTVKVNRLLLTNTDVRGVESDYLWKAGLSRSAWDALIALNGEGFIKPVVQEVGSFNDYGSALQKLADRKVVGRIVLTV